MRSEGLAQLTGTSNPITDFADFFRTSETDMMLTSLEAMLESLIWAAPQTYRCNPHLFAQRLNEILLEERLSFELVDRNMVPKESQVLHADVVAPTLRLLSGMPGWDVIEASYLKAIKEISNGSPDDAITDAGTALQEALQLAGCQGNALGPLISSAIGKKLLAPHDSQLNVAIGKIMDWVSADRSEMGYGHKGNSRATRDDAWFAVHIVGALILRLARGPRTSS